MSESKSAVFRLRAPLQERAGPVWRGAGGVQADGQAGRQEQDQRPLRQVLRQPRRAPQVNYRVTLNCFL